MNKSLRDGAEESSGGAQQTRNMVSSDVTTPQAGQKRAAVSGGF